MSDRGSIALARRVWAWISGHVGACISLAGLLGAAIATTVIYFSNHEVAHALDRAQIRQLGEDLDAHIRAESQLVRRLEDLVDSIERHHQDDPHTTRHRKDRTHVERR